MLRKLVAMAFLCFALMGLKPARAESGIIVLPNGCGTGNFLNQSGYTTMDSAGRICMSGAGSISGSVSDASSGVATSSTNVPTVSYNYNWNGLTWDQQLGLQVGTAGAPALDVVTVQSPITAGGAGFPAASVPITASSGNVAAATATATLAANSTKTTYLCGFSITSAGSTAAAVVSPTVTGLVTGAMPFTYVSVAGVTLPNSPLVVPFTPCAPASAINTPVVVSLPSLGSGNTNTTVSAWGFQQ